MERGECGVRQIWLPSYAPPPTLHSPPLPISAAQHRATNFRRAASHFIAKPSAAHVIRHFPAARQLRFCRASGILPVRIRPDAHPRRPGRAPFCTNFCIICPMQHPSPPCDRAFCHRRDLASRAEAPHMTETQPPILTAWSHPPSFLERQRGSMTDYDR